MPSRRPEVWLNDRWIPASHARVPVGDRSFLLGDAVFETVRVAGGCPFLWEEHWRRFSAGLKTLGLTRPGIGREIRQRIVEGAARQGIIDGVVRLHRTRGHGSRGLSTAGTRDALFLIQFHPPPPPPTRPLRLHATGITIPGDSPITRCKTASRLPWILARMEAEAAGADEGLMSTSTGLWVEATAANLGWIEGRTVCTPPVSDGALPGITRGLVARLCVELGWTWREAHGEPARVRGSDAVFLTNSVSGPVPVESIDGTPVGDPDRIAPLVAAHRRRLDRFARSHRRRSVP